MLHQVRFQAINFGTTSEIRMYPDILDLGDVPHYEFSFFETIAAAVWFLIDSMFKMLQDDDVEVSINDRDVICSEIQNLHSMLETEN